MNKPEKLILILLFSVSSMLSGQTVIVDYVLEGNNFYSKGKYTEAAEQYKLAIDNKQNVPFAWFNLGNCHAQKKNYHESVVAHRRSIEEAPQFIRPWLILGDIYYSMGAYGYAMVAYKRVLELERDNAYAWKWAGECALRGGHATEAMKNFDQALKLDPDQIDIYFALSETYAGIRDFEGAQDVLKDAILLSPEVDENVYFYLGYLYESSALKQKAIAAYEEGLAINPGRIEIYFRIAQIYRETDSDYLALLILEQAVNAGLDTPEIRLERALLFFDQDRLDKALEEFKIARNMGSPRGRTGMQNVANAWWNKGEKEKSKEIMEGL